MPLRQNKVKALEEWCAENSIFFGEKICLSNYGRSGIGVFSKEDCIQPQHTRMLLRTSVSTAFLTLDLNQIVVRISKSSVLSARSCSLAGVITHASYALPRSFHSPLRSMWRCMLSLKIYIILSVVLIFQHDILQVERRKVKVVRISAVLPRGDRRPSYVLESSSRSKYCGNWSSEYSDRKNVPYGDRSSQNS